MHEFDICEPIVSEVTERIVSVARSLTGVASLLDVFCAMRNPKCVDSCEHTLGEVEKLRKRFGESKSQDFDPDWCALAWPTWVNCDIRMYECVRIAAHMVEAV